MTKHFRWSAGVALTFAIVVLAACGDSSSDGGDTSAASSSTPAASATTPAASSTTAAATGGDYSSKTLCVDAFSLPALPTVEMVAGIKASTEKALGAKSPKVVVKTANADAAAEQTIAQGFVDGDCDVIASLSSPSTQVYQKLTKTKPIVFIAPGTPVELKFVQSMTRPGGNVTGVAIPIPVEAELKAMVKVMPDAKHVGFISSPGDAASDNYIKVGKATAEKLGLTMDVVGVSNPAEMVEAAQSLAAKGVDFIDASTAGTAGFVGVAGAVKGVAGKNVPVIGVSATGVQSGGLFAGASSYTKGGSMGADMSLKIMDGADPATMPVEVVPTNGFYINHAAFKELGIEVPSFMSDQEIETPKP